MPQGQIQSFGPADIQKVMWGRHRLDAELRSVEVVVNQEMAEDVRGITQRWNSAVPLGVGSVEATIEALFTEDSYAAYEKQNLDPNSSGKTLSIIRTGVTDIKSFLNLRRPPSTVKLAKDGLVLVSTSFVGGGSGEVLGRHILDRDDTSVTALVDGKGVWNPASLRRAPGSEWQTALVDVGQPVDANTDNLSITVSIQGLTLAKFTTGLLLNFKTGAAANTGTLTETAASDETFSAPGERTKDFDIAERFLSVDATWQVDWGRLNGASHTNGDQLTLDEGPLNGRLAIGDKFVYRGDDSVYTVTAVQRNGADNTYTFTPNRPIGQRIADNTQIFGDPVGSAATEVNVIVHRE